MDKIRIGILSFLRYNTVERVELSLFTPFDLSCASRATAAVVCTVKLPPLLTNFLVYEVFYLTGYFFEGEVKGFSTFAVARERIHLLLFNGILHYGNFVLTFPVTFCNVRSFTVYCCVSLCLIIVIRHDTNASRSFTPRRQHNRI